MAKETGEALGLLRRMAAAPPNRRSYFTGAEAAALVEIIDEPKVSKECHELHKAALKECVTMLTALVENNLDYGLIGTYPDPYGAINDAREVLGLPRIEWGPRPDVGPSTELAKQFITEHSTYSAEENGAIHAFAEWLDANMPGHAAMPVVVPISALTTVVPDSVLDQAYGPGS